MRKQTKILALLLTLVFIAGALSVLTFAADEPVHPTINVTGDGITQVQTDNFEDQAAFRIHWYAKNSFGTRPKTIPAYAKNHGYFELKKSDTNSYMSYYYERYESYGKLTVDTDNDGTPDATDLDGDGTADEYFSPSNKATTTVPGPVNATGSGDAIKYDCYWDVFSGTTPNNTGIFTGDENGFAYVEGKQLGANGEYLVQSDMLVFEFDFASDKYLTADGRLTDNKEEGVKLAYSTSVRFAPSFRASSASTYNAGSSNTYLYTGYDAESGRWYAYNSANKESRVYLAENVGDWNHVTYILKIDNTITYIPKGSTSPVTCAYNEAVRDPNFDLSTVTSYNLNNSKGIWFVNGQYVNETPLFSLADEKFAAAAYSVVTTASDKVTKVYNYVTPAGMCFTGLRLQDGNTVNASYAVAVDNMTSRRYQGSVGASGSYIPYSGDLASLLANESYKDGTTKITDCSDVAGNATYRYPAPNRPIATVTYKNNEKPAKAFYMVDGALAAIEEGCTLELASGVTGVECVATVNFRVKCENEGDFKVIGELKTAKPVYNGDVFDGYEVVQLDETTRVNVYYYGNYDDAYEAVNELTDAEVTVAENGSIEPLAGYGIGGILGAETAGGREFKTVSHWNALYLDENDEAQTFNITETVTPEVIDAVKRYNGSCISVYPVYETVYLAYTVTDGEGALIPIDGDYSYAVVGSSERIEECINKIMEDNADTVGITVTLYADAEVDTNTPIRVGENTISKVKHYFNPSLRFDLNGHSFWNYNFAPKGSGKTQMFGVGPDSELFIYSSKPGGEMIASCYASASTGAAGGADLGYIVMMNGAKNTTVSFGKYGTVSGDNLTVNAPCLIDNTSGSAVADEDRNSVIIDGGSYSRNTSGGAGFLVLRSNTYIEFKNATFFTNKSPMFGYGATYTYAAYDIVIDNSVIVCNSTLLNGIYENNSKVKITNSVIKASLSLDKKSETDTSYIEIGDGTKLTASAFGTAVRFAEGSKQIELSDPAFSASLPYFAVDYTLTMNGDTVEDAVIKRETFETKKENNVSFKIATYVVIPDAEELATLNMIGHDGSSLGTVTFVPGTLPDIPSVPEVDMGNTFFKLGFAGWVDESGDDFDFSACKAGETYTARVKMGITESFSGAMMNVLASVKFQPYVFIPVPAADYNGYTVTLDSKNTSKTTYVANGIEYYKLPISSYPGPTNSGSEKVYEIKYTVTDTATNESAEFTVSVNVLNLPDYLTKAMEYADEPGKKLIMAIVKFCATALEAKGSTVFPEYTALLGTYSSYLGDISAYNDDIEAQAARANTDALATYIDATYYISAGYMPFFVIKNNASVAVNAADALATGKPFIYAPNAGGSTYYTYDDFGKNTVINIYENAATYKYAGVDFGAGNNAAINSGIVNGTVSEEFMFNYNMNIPAYAFYRDITVTLSILPAGAVAEDAIDTSDITTVSGTYNLASYITYIRSQDQTVEANREAVEVMEAFYLYSMAAEAFICSAEQ